MHWSGRSAGTCVFFFVVYETSAIIVKASGSTPTMQRLSEVSARTAIGWARESVDTLSHPSSLTGMRMHLWGCLSSCEKGRSTERVVYRTCQYSDGLAGQPLVLLVGCGFRGHHYMVDSCFHPLPTAIGQVVHLKCFGHHEEGRQHNAQNGCGLSSFRL